MRLKWAERGIVFVLATYVGLYVSLLQPDIFIPCSLNSHFQMHLRATLPGWRHGGRNRLPTAFVLRPEDPTALLGEPATSPWNDGR